MLLLLPGASAEEITVSGASSQSYPDEVSWMLVCSDGSTVSGGSPFTGSFTAPAGGTCNLTMVDTYGDGWNGNQWRGFGQSFELAGSTEKFQDGGEECPNSAWAYGCAQALTQTFVVPQSPPQPPPSPPLSPPGPPGTGGHFTIVSGDCGLTYGGEQSEIDYLLLTPYYLLLTPYYLLLTTYYLHLRR